jgi:hypothetical protein
LRVAPTSSVRTGAISSRPIPTGNTIGSFEESGTLEVASERAERADPEADVVERRDGGADDEHIGHPDASLLEHRLRGAVAGRRRHVELARQLLGVDLVDVGDDDVV